MMDQFTDPLDVCILDAEREGRVLARLLRPFVYRDGLFRITVPAGFVTDFSSVPQPFWNIEPPLGDAGKAAVIHDFLYSTQGTGDFQGKRWIDRPAPYLRPEADGVFRAAQAVLGVPLWKRNLLWAAVRLGGAGGWGR